MTRERNRRVTGWAGKYKDVYLRSTLEFLYATYLDSQNIAWEYEAETLYLSSGESYKPDFKLSANTYVEVKGDYFFAKDSLRVQRFVDELGIQVAILSAKDIHTLIRSVNLPLERLKAYWKTVASNNVDVSGHKNPRHGVKLSASTLEKMSVGIKKAWQDPEIRERYRLANQRTDRSRYLKGKLKSERVLWTCPICETEKTLTKAQARVRKYCSKNCGSTTLIYKTREVLLENRQDRATLIKDTTHQWALENITLLKQPIKWNSLRPILDPLLARLSEVTGNKDVRTINLALGLTVSSRKDLVKYLVRHVENICGAVDNRNLQN